MCGIFGVVGRTEWVLGLRPEAAVRAMAHRGPDGSGLRRSPSLDLAGGGPSPACVLGHTRLSIIDLSDAAAQPMSTGDGRYTLVYNGEVYNFPEIRRELQGLGETFRSSGDSEVVLKACVRWGERAPERFRGMFALGLWDERERTLLLARDRLGVKPLYFAETPGGIAFASEVRALLAAGAVPRVLSARGLHGYLRFGSVQEPDTLVEGVRSLEPGTTLAWSGEGGRSRRYWALPDGPARPIARAEAVSEIRRLLHESVRMRLVSDVPFGVFLSGGVDSSALTALASAEASRPIHTFTVVFDEAEYSEKKHAEGIARRFGCVHHSGRVTGEEAGEAFDEALRSQDQPSGDGLNTWLVARAARREGLSMALSGLGGDEVFAGYSSYRSSSLLLKLSKASALLPDSVLSALAGAAARPASSNRFRKAVEIARSGRTAHDVHETLRTLFTDRQVEGLVRGSAVRPARERPTAAPTRASGDVVNDFSRFDLEGYLRNTLLRDADCMSMASAVEMRVPFLDHELLELVLRVPGRMKVEGEGNKALLLEAVPEVPRDAGLRPKKGFVLPLRKWFLGPMRGRIEELLLGLPGAASSILDRDAVARAFRAFVNDERAVSATRVFTLASLAAWTAEQGLAAE